MKNIFDKPKPVPQMSEEMKELIATGHVEVFKGESMIWVGPIRDIPENLKDQVWTKEP